MWKCEMCKNEFNDDIIAIEVKFGYIDSDLADKMHDQYFAFNSESSWAPLCDNCAVKFIKGENIEPEHQGNT